MLSDAQARGYAIGQFSLNHLESLRAYLLAAEEARSPVLLGASRGMVDYMGGHRAIAALLPPFIQHLGITVPVALHLDHGSFEEARAALQAGFRSVMFDGSALPFEENLAKSKELVTLCREYGATLECEVGTLGGEEDGIRGSDVPDEMVRRAIELGIRKVNVNTECVLAFAGAVRAYVEAGKNRMDKGYQPRALLADGAEAAKRVAMQKMELFGSAGKA